MPCLDTFLKQTEKFALNFVRDEVYVECERYTDQLIVQQGNKFLVAGLD